MAWYAPAFESLYAGSLRSPPFSSLAFIKKKNVRLKPNGQGKRIIRMGVLMGIPGVHH